MAGRIRSIAANTFRETIRNKILYAILAFALFVIGMTFFLADLSVGDLTRIIADVGLASIHLFGVIMAVFLGISLVSNEVDRKTIYMELLLLICLATLFSTFTTPVLSAIFTLSLFLVGHVTDYLYVVGERSQIATVRWGSRVLFYLLPNLENFNWKNEVAYGGARSLSVLGWAAGYLAAYAACVLCLSCLLFARKDFK